MRFLRLEGKLRDRSAFLLTQLLLYATSEEMYVRERSHSYLLAVSKVILIFPILIK